MKNLAWKFGICYFIRQFIRLIFGAQVKTGEKVTRIALCSKDRGVLNRLITLCAERCYALSICPGMKECYHLLRRRGHALGLFDTAQETEAILSVVWELRQNSVHMPIVAVVDEDGLDEDRLYRSGFDGVITRSASPERFARVIENFLHAGLSH